MIIYTDRSCFSVWVTVWPPHVVFTRSQLANEYQYMICMIMSNVYLAPLVIDIGHNCWLQSKCYSIQHLLHSISYISWLQLAAEYGGCSQ